MLKKKLKVFWLLNILSICFPVSLSAYGTNLCRCFQGVDVFSLDIIELNKGVPHDGRAGRLGGKPVSLHAGHSQEVSLRAPLRLNVCGRKGCKRLMCNGSNEH